MMYRNEGYTINLQHIYVEISKEGNGKFLLAQPYTLKQLHERECHKFFLKLVI
jgi:hypothetical protein